MDTLRYVGPHERLKNREQALSDLEVFVEIVKEQGGLTHEDRDFFNLSDARDVEHALSYQASKDLAEMDMGHLSECELCQMDHEGAEG